jgi:hypothetical protein
MKYKGKCGGLWPQAWDERVAWCYQTFGPMSHSRWWAKPIIEIRFQNEKDYLFYYLRWGE